MLPNFASAGTTNITDCGYLDLAGETYVLQNDVSSTGSCFAIIASNVTLDLNGHTVTYDNGAHIILPNGDFENGTGAAADNWDMSLAPNIQRSAGTYVQPVTVYSGSYALKIAVPSADQEVRSVAQVTLEPNTTYSISAMVYNNYYSGGYQSDAITLYAGLDDGTTDKTAIKTGITWRGFQYIYKKFTTGATPESYNVIAGISGAAGAVAGSVFIDDIKIQKHQLAGVFVGPANWKTSRYPDLNRYGNAPGAIITNGKIIQGQGLSDYSDSIYVEENSGSYFDFNNLEISTKGASSRSVFSYNMLNGNIHDNLIHHEINTITSRDAYDGAAIKIEYGGDGGKIYNNVIDKSIQTAICGKTKDGGMPVQIYGNTIAVQSKYTNDFAITSGGSIIHDNVIDCTSGSNSCRGIPIGGEGTEVYNNTVSVQQLLRNQEYNGCEMSGAYGMQMEYTANNVNIYNNTVTAKAGICEAYAFRANPDIVSCSNNSVHNNIFIAIAEGSARAASIKYGAMNGIAADVHDNIFRTNHRWIYADGGGPVVNPTFRNNTWQTSGTLPDPFRPFEVYTYASTYFTGTFYDNSYGSPEDKARFESEVFRTSNGNPEPNSSFTVVATDTIAPNAPTGLDAR